MTWTGMSRTTGKTIDDAEHIRQSIHDILTTPIGSRLMRREYGSLIPDLIDQPSSAGTPLRLVSASIMAIMRWEPRITIQSVNFAIDLAGKASLDLVATRRTGPRSGRTLNLSVILK